ncbi:unnamed protein product [Amoebophrya sp. A25]|nr:unnamed protein product [Amoebophrya sp. A25]|eukprot:GSA25T00007843001.1
MVKCFEIVQMSTHFYGGYEWLYQMEHAHAMNTHITHQRQDDTAIHPHTLFLFLLAGMDIMQQLLYIVLWMRMPMPTKKLRRLNFFDTKIHVFGQGLPARVSLLVGDRQ